MEFLKSKSIRSIARDVWAVSWPITFIMFYEFLIGLTDVYVAGKFGKTAQAAYGFSFQMYFVFIILGIALSIGSVSVISRLATSGRVLELRQAVSSCLQAAVALGAVFVIIGVFFSKHLIAAAYLPFEIKKLAVEFMKIYSVAFVFEYLLMNNNGILRATGMVRKSLWVMTGVCVLNIALDFILAFRTPLGFRGIAGATVISVAIGALITLHFTGALAQAAGFSRNIIKQVFNISWPSGLLQGFMQIGYLALFSILGMLPSRNTEIMAALTNGLKIESAIFLPAIAFNMGAAVIVGNRLGKKDKGAAFNGGIVTAVMGVAIILLITAAVMINAPRIASLLTDNMVVAKESVRYIYIALIAEPFLAWGIILGGGLNGAGDTRNVMLAAFTGIWLVRLPLCYILGVRLGLGVVAVWWSMNISVFVQSSLVTWRYFSRRWVKDDI